MSSIKNISISNPVPQDLAKRLGQNGIGIILMVFWMGYMDLKKSSIITESTDEDTITVEWYTKIYERWTSENRASQVNVKLIPIHQYPDDTLRKKQGKAPTIDFCFRAWNKEEGYFGAECKRLRSDNKKLLKEYVINGTQRFVSGKYGSNCSESAMVGYVQQGDILNIVESLKPFLKDEYLEENLIREVLVSYPQYKSVHVRSLDLQNITIHHLFFDFVS